MAYSSVACIVSLAVRIILSYIMVSLFENMVIAYAEAFSWVVLLLLYILRLLMIRKSGKLKIEQPAEIFIFDSYNDKC